MFFGRLVLTVWGIFKLSRVNIGRVQVQHKYKPPAPLKASHLQPPEGFETWLEYAVASFDSRAAVVDTIFEDTSSQSRDWLEATVWSEFNALRVQAGLPELPVRKR